MRFLNVPLIQDLSPPLVLPRSKIALIALLSLLKHYRIQKGAGEQWNKQHEVFCIRRTLAIPVISKKRKPTSSPLEQGLEGGVDFFGSSPLSIRVLPAAAWLLPRGQLRLWRGRTAGPLYILVKLSCRRQVRAGYTRGKFVVLRC